MSGRVSPTIETLLALVETDPYPSAFTSSYWREHGARNVVERRAGVLKLDDRGIGEVRPPHPLRRPLQIIERFSYRDVTRPLRSYPEVWRLAKRLARELGFGLTFDVWKYAVVASILTDHWASGGLQPRMFVMIGDGHGFLGALLLRLRGGGRLYCVDLPKALVFQARTHERTNPRARLGVLGKGDRDADVWFVVPQDVESIADTVDCCVNIASMQEMNEYTIETYFRFLRRRSTPTSRFYCANRKRKTLPGGEVSAFESYPWQPDDEIFLDEPAPYYRHYVAKSTRPEGPRVLGVRVPFVNAFEGEHRHRLVRLASLERVIPG